MDKQENETSRKEYQIPDELLELWIQYLGCMKLRDRYIELRWFGYKPARRAAADAERFRRDFWDGVRDLYPELDERRVSFDQRKRVVTVTGTD